MFRQLFTDHPHSVGETYLQHQAAALSFAWPLLLASLGATLHAFVPGLCQKTGSRTILSLHARITSGQGRGAAAEVEYMI